jgi:hypothetical protein
MLIEEWQLLPFLVWEQHGLLFFENKPTCVY